MKTKFLLFIKKTILPNGIGLILAFITSPFLLWYNAYSLFLLVLLGGVLELTAYRNKKKLSSQKEILNTPLLSILALLFFVVSWALFLGFIYGVDMKLVNTLQIMLLNGSTFSILILDTTALILSSISLYRAFKRKYSKSLCLSVLICSSIIIVITIIAFIPLVLSFNRLLVIEYKL